VCCYDPSLLCIIVVYCYCSMGFHWCALLALPKYLFNFLLLLGSSLLCVTTIPPHCPYGSALLVWYYPSPLFPCRWRKRNKKLQVQFFSRWVFILFIVYIYMYVFCEHVWIWIFFCCIWKNNKNDLFFHCKCLWMFCFHFHCINMLKLIKH
jgi:hypothetical protein